MSTQIDFTGSLNDDETRVALNLPRKILTTSTGAALTSGFPAVREAESCSYNALLDLDRKRLLHQASLLLLPSTYGEGRLFSQKPVYNTNGTFTVTRATTATRVNSSGLVDLVPYNLIRYSEMFADASWTKAQATISANVTTAPDGTLTADKLIPNNGVDPAAPNATLLLQSGALPSAVYTFSVYAKAAEFTSIRFREGVFSGQLLTVDLTNGSISGGGSQFVSPSAINVGNGWYRISFTSNSSFLMSNLSQYVIRCAVTGDGTSGIFLWGAQLVEGTSARDYLRTETRLNIPRLDYSLGGCPNILLEPQRTNLALQSSSFDNTTIWANIIGGTGVNPTRVANSVISPSGVQDADTITFNRGAGNTSSDQSVINQQITIATTGTYYFSIWLKATASGDIGKQVFIRCGNAGILQAVTLTANWVRYETTASVTAGANGFQVGNRGGFTASNSVSVDLWGAQLEAGAYATSFIPTTTASVTRNADSITRSNIFTNGLITASGGTWFVELRNNVSIAREITTGGIFINTGTISTIGNGFVLRNAGSAAARMTLSKVESGTLTNLYTTLTDIVKIAIKWNGSTADVFVNGVKQVSATAFTPTAMQNLIADGINRAVFINEMALFPTPLTDAQCILMTT